MYPCKLDALGTFFSYKLLFCDVCCALGVEERKQNLFEWDILLRV